MYYIFSGIPWAPSCPCLFGARQQDDGSPRVDSSLGDCFSGVLRPPLVGGLVFYFLITISNDIVRSGFVTPLCDRPGRERYARGVTPGWWLPLNLFLGFKLCWPMRPPRTLHLTLVLPGVAVLDGWRESPTKRDFGFVSIHGFGFSMLSRPFLPFYCTVLGDGIGIGLPGFGNEKQKRKKNIQGRLAKKIMH